MSSPPPRVLESLEWRRLSTLCQSVDYLPAGANVNLVAQPFQEPHHAGDRVFCRARISNGEDPVRIVLLVLRAADWQIFRLTEAPLKILQAKVQYDSQVPVLDCTSMDAAVVSTAMVQDHTSLQVAEIFSGGFAGWAQACYVFRHNQVPIHVRWSLDVDPQCTPMLRCREPNLQQISTLQELDQLPDNHEDPFHLCADVQWGWWVRVLGRFPVNVLCVSAPCQPWSRAGTGSGLCSSEGQLLLRIADIAGACKIPIVLLEQVEFFPKHQHFAQVMQAWQECGYTVLWQQSLNLRDVLPGQRMRHLIVLGRPGLPAGLIDQGFWAVVKRQSLALADVIFPLPPALLSACSPEPDTLAKYMDPWLVPTPARPGARPQTPQQFRIKKPQDHASVFIAQYQHQHELPPRMLEQQGLHGCLLEAPSGLRFFAGAEIAAIHGAVQPVYLTNDQRDQMRLLGNAIAVPHAAAALAQACRLTGSPKAPEMMLATQWCLAERVHCSNSALMPAKEGWILCKHDQVAAVIQTMHTDLPPHLNVEAPAAFVQILLSAPGHERDTMLLAPPGLQTAVLLEVLGVPAADKHGCPAQLPWVPAEVPVALSVQQQPQLHMSGFLGGIGVKSGLCTVLTQQCTYLVDHSGPRAWSQLLRVFQDLDPDNDSNCSLGVYSLSGQRLTDHKLFGSCVVAVSEDDDIPAFLLSRLAPHLPSVSVHCLADGLLVRGPSAAAADLWIGFPFQVLSTLGWSADVIGLPPREHLPIEFHLQPVAGRSAMPVDLMHNQCRVWFFTSQAEHASADTAAADGIDVELQLVACKLWSGRLPRSLPLQEISRWWHTASCACSVSSTHRIASGPHLQGEATDLNAVANSSRTNVIRRTGHLLVTILPEIVGGGVKDENLQLAKTRVATLLLDRGVSLPETTVTVDNLVPKLGSATCLKVMAEADTAQQWLELKKVASSVGVPLPQGDNRTEKAARRLQRAVRRRKLNQPSTVRARDFQLEEGSWVGIDGAPVRVLTTATHASEGVLLLDASEATPVDLDLLRNIESDALCIVVPGHECPDPQSCGGAVSTPARHRTSGQVHLLAACYHNVGSTDIEPFVQHGTDITVTGTTCCAFFLHKADFPSGEWQEVVRAPVRAAADAFRQRGVPQAFKDPWSRQYRCEGRPSQPHLCDQCSFNAKVTTALLRPLLQQSGFNNVFIVPKTWDRQLLPGWAVVWLASDRSDTEKQAALVAEQHGLVRTKNRFGIRVPAEAFEKVFRQLRPGIELPPSISVRSVFKVGPFPAGTAADDVVAWAAKLGWPAKAMKALGPKFWLLGAATQPPAQTTRFNSTPVLITEVKGQEQQRPVIQAGGPLPREAPAPEQGADPWQDSDPWSQYKASQPTGWSTSKPSLSAKASSTAPPTLDSHMAGRLHDTESRLAELEQSVLALRDDQAKAATERQQDRQKTAADLQGVRGELQSLGASLQHQLQTNLDGLRNAQLQQEQQMSSGMQELKALILACNENKKARTSDPEL